MSMPHFWLHRSFLKHFKIITLAAKLHNKEIIYLYSTVVAIETQQYKKKQKKHDLFHLQLNINELCQYGSK